MDAHKPTLHVEIEYKLLHGCQLLGHHVVGLLCLIGRLSGPSALQEWVPHAGQKKDMQSDFHQLTTYIDPESASSSEQPRHPTVVPPHERRYLSELAKYVGSEAYAGSAATA